MRVVLLLVELFQPFLGLPECLVNRLLLSLDQLVLGLELCGVDDPGGLAPYLVLDLLELHALRARGVLVYLREDLGHPLLGLRLDRRHTGFGLVLKCLEDVF